jgi:hypothetical protein
MQTPSLFRSRWWMPSFCLFLGALMFAAFAIGGEPGQGAISFGIMALLGAVFLFGRRSETLQGLGGPGRDERWAMIDINATAAAGLVLILTVLGAWLYEIANGDDGNPFGWLAAVAGLAYIAAVAFFRWRS